MSKKPSNDKAKKQERPQERTAGAVAELPVLRYGQRNNLAEFIHQLDIYVTRELGGDIAYTIKNRVWIDIPSLPPLTDEELELDDDLMEELKAERSEMRKHIVKRRNDLQLAKPRLFAIIEGNLSPESREKVLQAEDWPEIEADKDPLRLIERTHYGANTGNAAGPCSGKERLWCHADER